ncbi:MAG: FMN-binding protein [Bacteroidales bacterium]|nr:FMN-binding protein [Bacteroidales bacterium]
MKKAILILGILAVLGSTCLMSTSCGTNAGAKGADTLKVNTTELGAEVIGFNGITPVEISVHKGVITKIEALPNQESPRYFQAVLESGLLEKLVGKTVKEAKATELDAVSGATFSSEALIQNIRLGLEAVPE